MLHQELQEASDALGIELPTLAKAALSSQERVRRAREYLTDKVPVPDGGLPLDVVALGSIAREESSDESDFDYLIVAHGVPVLIRDKDTGEEVSATRKLLATTEDLREAENIRSPGATGMFGQIISAPDLIERIGLEQDTNETHTHRILLLEESVSIYQPELHETLIRAMLDRYVDDYRARPKKGVPRFLLNDVERYWRTLCVDYQAKYWRQIPLGLQEKRPASDYGWGLRYLKLIISRKLAFVGTVTSLLLCKPLEIAPTIEYLAEQFGIPPLARFAQLHKHLGDEELTHLREALLIAEAFSAALGTREFRDAAKAIKNRAELEGARDLDEMRSKARDLQSHLECIFFSPPLKEASETYLSF